MLQQLVNLQTPDRLADVLNGLKKHFGNLQQVCLTLVPTEHFLMLLVSRGEVPCSRVDCPPPF